MNKIDLISKAKECLAFNKLAKEVIVIEDGTCFLEGAKTHAANYANSKGLKKELFTREELNEYDKVAKEQSKLKAEAKAKEKAEQEAKVKAQEKQELKKKTEAKAENKAKEEVKKMNKKTTTK